jgi:uncharacterized protein (TIGR02145 family)
MANTLGHGKTQISFRQLETNNPEFNIKTIQPLSDLTDASTELTFTQAQVSSGENHGERRATFNLGIGQRYLLEDGQSIAGINLFTDYETESKHSRASLGLEYRRANFSANVNQYHPLSDKVVIGDYTEEPLAGYDIRLTGQVPYLPWAKIKATQYYWDATTGDNIKGTRLGIEANINAATTFEIGTENSNTASRSGYAQLRIQYPYNTAPTQFIIADKAFEDSTKLSLTHLNYVERSNKIRIEKLLNGVSVILGEYNAATVGATCTLYNASNVAIANGSGVTGLNGIVTLSNVVLPTGLVSSVCTGGQYTDEATGVVLNAPSIRAGTIYSGTGDETILTSPLSEIAYQLAGTNLANTITLKNAEVATAFGLNSVDILGIIPTDINTTSAANDDAGKIATVLAAISQMGDNAADADPTVTITALVNDMKGSGGIGGGTIEGRGSVDIATAINNFKNGASIGADNIDVSIGEGSIKGRLAITFIDAYDGTGTAPTIQQYVDAGVTGVTANNLAAVNAAVANQTAGTTAEIQTLANDNPMNVAFNLTSSSATEATGNQNLVVYLTAASGQAVTVNYTVTGTATSGTDYTLANGTATIAAGSTSTNIVLAIVEDALYETNETVIVALSSPSNASLGTNTVHTHTITNDDLPFATVVIGTQTWSASNVSIVPADISAVDGIHYWTTFTGASGTEDDNDGYYYTWDEALTICPDGWSLPSDDDFAILEEAAVDGDSGVSWTDTEGWRGTTEGTELLPGESTGFGVKYAGGRLFGDWYNRGSKSYMWTSTTKFTNTLVRYMDSAYSAQIGRGTMERPSALSVRCLKN